MDFDHPTGPPPQSSLPVSSLNRCFYLGKRRSDARISDVLLEGASLVCHVCRLSTTRSGQRAVWFVCLFWGLGIVWQEYGASVGLSMIYIDRCTGDLLSIAR